MTVPRFYNPAPMVSGQVVSLEGDNIHYAQRVLRMRQGDPLELIDGLGFEYRAVIRAIGMQGVSIEILEKTPVQEPPIRLTLAQSLLKAGKLDFIVQRSVELGVNSFIPFVSSRSIVRLSPDAVYQRVERWRKIASEAARQCGRTTIPVIEPVISFRDMLARPREGALKVIFWEAEAERTIRRIFHDADHPCADHFFFVVGPEGGFSGEEVCEAREAGFLSASIGERVLKVETAVMSILTILQYERGIFSRK
ncbi:MAG: 16S rRNA (uracil(1498)-N(3))-methyltransferase [Syntrophales bacterium]|nr:16S rRNA (uracil(1498)-N(3))-methyltransferase [Syntrophales bacterium]